MTVVWDGLVEERLDEVGLLTVIALQQDLCAYPPQCVLSFLPPLKHRLIRLFLLISTLPKTCPT